MGNWSHRIAASLGELGYAPTLWFADDFGPVTRLGRLSVLVFPVAFALRLVRARSDFDAVIVHEASGFWYGVLRRLFPQLPPMVAMCHNVESKHFRELLRAAEQGLASVPLTSRLKCPVFRLWQSDGAIRMADHVVCLSAVDRRYLIQHLGCRPDRVTHMINGVTPEELHREDNRCAGLRVLFVGGWLDVKGRRLLPSIWAKVRAQLPQSQLTIVGAGLAEHSVLQDFNPADRASVSVIPRVTDPKQMRAEFARHDLFLMPSLSEGSPLALLEAMAAALPVVASRSGGIPDIIAHEQNGLLFDTAEVHDAAAQVCRVLSDAPTARRLAAAGQQRAAALSWVDSARTLGTVAKAVVGDSRGAPAQTSTPKGLTSPGEQIGGTEPSSARHG